MYMNELAEHKGFFSFLSRKEHSLHFSIMNSVLHFISQGTPHGLPQYSSSEPKKNVKGDRYAYHGATSSTLKARAEGAWRDGKLGASL